MPAEEVVPSSLLKRRLGQCVSRADIPGLLACACLRLRCRTKQVGEMRALIKATPVPSHVADRLVRKIVHGWVFLSDERLPIWTGTETMEPLLRQRK